MVSTYKNLWKDFYHHAISFIVSSLEGGGGGVEGDIMNMLFLYVYRKGKIPCIYLFSSKNSQLFISVCCYRKRKGEVALQNIPALQEKR